MFFWQSFRICFSSFSKRQFFSLLVKKKTTLAKLEDTLKELLSGSTRGTPGNRSYPESPPHKSKKGKGKGGSHKPKMSMSDAAFFLNQGKYLRHEMSRLNEGKGHMSIALGKITKASG